MPTLSVCLIVRNEEAHLERCLSSLRGLWDDLVVVDTGSRDRTVDIARGFGARMFEFTWQDDFSAARNFCISQATGDWILSIDADETVAARDHARIRKLIAPPELDAVLAFQRHYLTATVIGWQAGDGGYDEGRPYPGYLDVECRRLFRNRPWIRFRNRVHEEIVSTDASRPLAERHGGWVIHHFGKVADADVLRAKGEAYIRIAARKVEECPDDPQAHYEQGLTYGELRRHAEALPCFERAHALAPGFRDVALRIAICHVRAGDRDRALPALRAAARRLPQHAAVIALEEGNVHRAAGDYDAAEQAFRRALAADRNFAGASVNLALTLLDAKRPDDARTCAAEALARNAAHPELRAVHDRALVAVARVQVRDGRLADAAQTLDALVDPANAEAESLRGAIALGAGRVQPAIAHLRASLALAPTQEAALNLSTALAATGDAEGACTAAADACRLAPDDERSIARLAQVTGDTFRTPAGAARESLAIMFYQPHSLPYDGETPRTRGLGGVESAVVYLAEALARRGHRIAVFNTSDQTRMVNGVEYAPWETMPPRAVAERPDVIVGVRFWRLLAQVRLAPLQIFWTGDAYDQPFLADFAAAPRDAIDLVMLQSAWHEATFRQHHGVAAGRIALTKLGAAASAIADRPTPPSWTRPRKVAYASTPFRGLDVLLDLFPRIRAAIPDAELDVFSSMRVYGVDEERDRQQFGALYAKAEQPGVRLIGSVAQPELAARLHEARVLAYPNHYAETFCIAAIEAQAAGCAVVTSALGALPETVGDGGVCIPGHPSERAYQDAFVNACVELLADDERWQAASERATARAWSHYTWPSIADAWERTIRTALSPEPAIIGRLAVHLANGRAALAQKMLQREPCPEGLPAAAWDALQQLVAWRAGGAVRPADEALRLVTTHFRSLAAQA